MIRENLRWMAAVAVATNLAIVTPSGLMAGQGDAHKKDADTFRTTHQSSTWS